MDRLNRERLTVLPLSERQHKMTVADVYALDAEPAVLRKSSSSYRCGSNR